MDTALIILTSFAIVLLIVVIVLLLLNKPKTNDKETSELKDYLKEENFKLSNKLTEEYGELRLKISESINKSSKESLTDLNTFKDGLNKQIVDSFTGLSKTLNDQMNSINQRVENRLTEGFEKTNKTFMNVLERLSKIDEAQKNIEKLSTDVTSLQHILTDKKSRGTFGEVQLNHILESIFGENNTKVFETQYTLSNGKIVDALLHIGESMGDLAIDSKFPLENYQRMVDHELTERERVEATRKFKADLKKHVDDIATKYIILQETAEQAVMFIPAEAIFAEINAYHQDVIQYAQKKRVWMASPTTLMSFLTTVQVLLQNIERDKHAKVIQEELIKLGDEFNRYRERWNKLSRSIEAVRKDAEKVTITTEKITKRFDEISAVEIEEKEQIE
jgi:DNA recombination protein RmuC